MGRRDINIDSLTDKISETWGLIKAEEGNIYQGFDELNSRLENLQIIHDNQLKKEEAKENQRYYKNMAMSVGGTVALGGLAVVGGGATLGVALGGTALRTVVIGAAGATAYRKVSNMFSTGKT